LKPAKAALKTPVTTPQPALSGKYFRDREHFRGYPVSKIIGDAGHWVSKPVSVSRALRGSVGFLAVLFSRWSEWPQPETGLFPAQIW
jgi:hypothetical protein